jgi:hypothetical protein
MPRRKKTFPCGHKGFGSLCHACRDRELAREREEAARRDARAAKQAVLEAAPIPLDGLPFQVAEKAVEVIEAVTAGRPWQDFKGKKIETRRGIRIVVPLGWSHRLLFRWDAEGGLAPEEALTHEAYNNLFR